MSSKHTIFFIMQMRLYQWLGLLLSVSKISESLHVGAPLYFYVVIMLFFNKIKYGKSPYLGINLCGENFPEKSLCLTE